MNWEDFIAGRISVYCGGRSGAERFLNECDEHCIKTFQQRKNLDKYPGYYAYRFNGDELILYPCDDESEWDGQLGIANVTEVLRYSEIQNAAVQIGTLDELL